MGIIDWLWNNTLSPETQEAAMIDSYLYEARSQEWANSDYEQLAAERGKDTVDEYLLGCMQQRHRLRTQLEERGYEFSQDDDEEEEESENTEDAPGQQSHGLLGWLFG